MDEKILQEEFFAANMRFRRVGAAITFGALSKGELAILGQIQRHLQQDGGKGIYVSELAKRLDVSLPSVSRSLQALEEKGFIARETDKSSRRNTFVSLTAQGDVAYCEARTMLLAFYDKVFAQIGQEKICEIIESMNELTEAIHLQWMEYCNDRSEMCGRT